MFNMNNSLMMLSISLMMFTFNYKHLLLTLINLEFMMINTFYLMYMIMNFLKMNLFFSSFFIALSICEGILGLSILVYMIRNSGNDYTHTLNLMKW